MRHDKINKNRRSFSIPKQDKVGGVSDMGNKMKILKIGLMLVLIFSAVFLTHANSLVVTSWDSSFSTLVIMSMLENGNAHLDKYVSILKARPNMSYAYQYINGHYYWLFPIGTPLLAAPIFIIYRHIGPALFTKAMRQISYMRLAQLFIASFIIALTAVFVYLNTYFSTGNTVLSSISFAIFAFCTSAWSTGSRALWQHGPAMLMLSMALCLILLAKKWPPLIRFVSLPLAFSYVIRPTNAISIVLFTLFVFLEHRRYFLSYLLWSVTIIAPFLFYNLISYNSLLPAYYLPIHSAYTHNFGSLQYFWIALVGHLFSPSRGIFIWSPVLLFSVYGMFLRLSAPKAERLDLFLVLIIIMHWIAISSYPHWHGDFSIGNRVFSDMMPFFVFFLPPAMVRITQMKGLKKIIVIFIFFILTAISFAIHYRCATDPGPALWNNKAWDEKGDEKMRSKVWDWHDIQFLNGLKK